jgi:hypothetical protein
MSPAGNTLDHGVDPANLQSQPPAADSTSTLLPMLIAGLVMIVVGMVLAMIFA